MATEWEDALVRTGVKEATVDEDAIEAMLDEVIEQKTGEKAMEDRTLDELDEIEDEINDDDEAAFEAYRKARLAELHQLRDSRKFGNLLEITKTEWQAQVSDAKDDAMVVIHIYRTHLPLCRSLNTQAMPTLAQRHPHVKFIKAEADMTIPNYPDRNCPSIFIYQNGKLLHQLIGGESFGTDQQIASTDPTELLEWLLSGFKVVETELEEDPRYRTRDVSHFFGGNRRKQAAEESDDDDW